jgi:hypothetical protein
VQIGRNLAFVIRLRIRIILVSLSSTIHALRCVGEYLMEMV